MRKVLFIDRDGTLVEEPEDFQVDRLDKVRLVPGVIPALWQLQQLGFDMVMVSNQDGLGSASYAQADFDKVHGFIVQLFASQGIAFSDTLICPHLPSEGCACRKPRTGLLTSYLKDRGIDWQQSAVIGDRTSDVEFAKALGVKVFQLSTGGGPWSWTSLAQHLTGAPRTSSVSRRTNETEITVDVNLDGDGRAKVATGIGFFDHMLEQLARHSGIDLRVEIAGDQHIDDHHSVEDAGLTIGTALRQALSDKVNIGRYGFALPMDECRSEALIDLSGRAVTKIEIPFSSSHLGQLATEMIPHFFQSLALSAGINLHITTSPGNNHHMAEASFKSFARALRQAVARFEGTGLPSTKGVL